MSEYFRGTNPIVAQCQRRMRENFRLAVLEAEESEEDDFDEDAEEVQCAAISYNRWNPQPPLSNAANGGDMPDKIVWMPIGTHCIDAGLQGGGSLSDIVTCDHAAFEAVLESFEEATAAGKKCWLDIDHSDSADDVCAYITGFEWDPARGIMASVEWTEKGEAAVRNKILNKFSPAFMWNKIKKVVVGLLPQGAAGGLVREPAFAVMPAFTS